MSVGKDFEREVYFASKLFPGFGFFGYGDDFNLKVRAGCYVSKLKISVEQPREEFLNLSKIDFLDNDGSVIRKIDIVKSVCASSMHKNLAYDAMDAFVSGKLIHTEKEVNPCVVVEFFEPVFMSVIEINNRADVHGRRSKHLKVSILDGNGKNELLHENFNEVSLVKEANNFLVEIGYQYGLPETDNELSTFFREVYSLLYKKISVGGLGDVNEYARLLPVYENDQVLSELGTLACSGILVNLLEKSKEFDTRRLKPISSVLCSDVRLKKVGNIASRLLEKVEGKKFDIVVSKHSVHNNRLLGRKEKFLSALSELMGVMEDLKVTPMICYGTLLGAVRENSLLKHDDDVDVLVYYDDIVSFEEMRNKNKWLISRLTELGYPVKVGSNPNFHVRVGGVAIDVFPAWGDFQNAHVVMERLEYRKIDKDIIVPTDSIDLHGVLFPAPASPKGFLEERYGDKWFISNPYHEWPWKIRTLSLESKCSSKHDLCGQRNQRKKGLNRANVVAWGQCVNQREDRPPSNSFPIIHQAISFGFDTIELDVRVSRDGVPFLAHDDVVIGPGGKIKLSDTLAEDIDGFVIGKYKGEPCHIKRLLEAIPEVQGLDILLDARVKASDAEVLKECFLAKSFDLSKLHFCVYGYEQAKSLKFYFPESTLLWKIPKPYYEVGSVVLDEVKASGVDGVMLYYPLHDEGFDCFMYELRRRELKVLFYIHGVKNRKFMKDDKEASFFNMVVSGVDFITTASPFLNKFKLLVGAGDE